MTARATEVEFVFNDTFLERSPLGSELKELIELSYRQDPDRTEHLLRRLGLHKLVSSLHFTAQRR